MAQVDEIIQRMDQELKQAEAYGRDIYAAKRLLENACQSISRLKYCCLLQKAPGAEVSAAVETVQNSQSLQGSHFKEWKRRKARYSS
ncbi:hypothetical protein ACEQPO_08610 [Bacillus sp. SL00103]